MAVKRIWHGWTTPENADAYRKLLLEEVIPGIRAKNIPGYRGIEVLRREPDGRHVAQNAAEELKGSPEQNAEGEVEFITIMTFDSLDNVIAFQGEEYRKAYVPEKARALLKRWDAESAHYEVADDIVYGD